MADATKASPMAANEAIEAQIRKLEKASREYESQPQDKVRRMTKIIASLTKRVDAFQADDAEAKAQAACWKGRALGLLPEYNAEAESLLSKAVKLDPSLVEAWNSLGSEFWKKRDLKSAGDCFREALEQRKNKVSLRRLSMVVRNLGDKKSAQTRLQESIGLAKQAVALDIKDGESWYILGNAYMRLFFNTFETADLERCLKTYDTAERCSTNPASGNPDLHYNRANVHKFYERYQKAIDGYKKAVALDPQLPLQEQIDALRRFVKRTSKLIATKNGIKKKRLLQLVERIPAVEAIGEFKRAELVKLSNRTNKDKFIVGVTIAAVSRPETAPVSFIVMDKNTDMFVVSVYGVVSSLINVIKPGDVMYVNQPNLRHVSVTEFKERTYPCITVSNATKIAVNGKSLPKKSFARPTARVEALNIMPKQKKDGKKP